MDNSYIAKQYKRLWVDKRPYQDGYDERITGTEIALVNPDRTVIHTIITLDSDADYKSKGDLSIYEFQTSPLQTNCLSQEEFIHKYMDGDVVLGPILIMQIKMRLNSFYDSNRKPCINETSWNIKKDNDKVYMLIKNKTLSTCLIFGINLNKEYAENIFVELVDEYEPVKICKDNEERFSLIYANDSQSRSPIINIFYLKKETKEDCNKLFKNFMELSKSTKYKINDLQGLKYGISLYDDYSKWVDEYNKKIDELKQKALAQTFNGAKIKKYEYMNDNDRKMREEISKLNNETEQMLQSHNNYSKGLRYYELLKSVKKHIDTMKSVSENFIGGTVYIYCNHSSIDEFNIKGIQHTFDRKTNKMEDLKDFITKSPTKEFYVTYEDKNGNTFVKKTRLFYNQGLAEYHKGSSKHGHYIDTNWVRVDYFVK